MGLPLDDPQFWLVTAAAVGGLVYGIRVVRRRARKESGSCDRCPVPRPDGKRNGRGLALALAMLLPAVARAETVERRVAAMGTQLTVSVDGAADRVSGLEIAERAIAAVEAAERRLSTWGATSELARLNRALPGAAVRLAPETTRELDAALACAAKTGSAFDPTVAPLVAAWDLRGAGRRPTEVELAGALERVGFDRLELRPAEDLAIPRGPLAIEEGGFGKGAALDAALEAVAADGVAMRIDFGGQVAWTGAREPLRLEVADPADRGRPAVELELAGTRGSLATSGTSERSRTVDGERIGHLLDPRSGRPAPQFGSVSVWTNDALRADCLSTALYVLGPERGLAWAEAAAGVEAIFLIEGDGTPEVRATRGLAGRWRRIDRGSPTSGGGAETVSIR